ncbi:hypothetical protein, partial [Neisseria dumasiana]|uniref:hypothetical protein n=1 Tax=Neisseria dumasiana TaxID=1931275 RepID=UPI001E63AEAB
LGQLCVAHMQSFLQERPYATAYWPFSVVESCTSNLNPLPSEKHPHAFSDGLKPLSSFAVFL